MPSTHWPSSIPGSSTACCSRPPPPPSSASAAIPVISGATWASPPSCIPGGRISPTTSTSTASSPAAPWPPTARWIPARPGFLFPVRALAKVFRGTYLAALHRAVARGDLPLSATLAPLADAVAFQAWLTDLRRQAWVVYCNPPFASPDHVLAYLGRYTHRVAIANDRLLSLADNRVRFRWRDYADGDRVKVMDLAADEFLRRFLQHIVPEGFVRIRHFGLLANCRRQAALATCRTLLAAPPPPPATEAPESVRALMLRVTGIDINRCPVCQLGLLRPLGLLLPAPVPWNTS
jgi:hypothetical protein